MPVKDKFLNKSNSYNFYKSEYSRLTDENKELKAKIMELENQIKSLNQNASKFSDLNEKLDAISDMMMQNNKKGSPIGREILYSSVFRDTIRESEWLKRKDFSLIKGAANYSLAYLLYRILNEACPKNILELGLGQSSKITSQYANHFDDVELSIIEGDDVWIDKFSQNIDVTDNIDIIHRDVELFEFEGSENLRFKDISDAVGDKKFDLIIVDAPQGFAEGYIFYEYSRSNIWEMIPDNLADDFIIIVDDYERSGEQHTVERLERMLDENNIEYSTYTPSAFKQQHLIFTQKYSFIAWI